MISPHDEHDLNPGLDLFNGGRFLDAHEALEDDWRVLPRTSAARKHAQGLVQLAVAFHHESRSNLRGARSVLERALRNLRGAETSFPNLDLEQLHRDMADWQRYLSHGKQRPAPPRIALRDRQC